MLACHQVAVLQAWTRKLPKKISPWLTAEQLKIWSDHQFMAADSPFLETILLTTSILLTSSHLSSIHEAHSLKKKVGSWEKILLVTFGMDKNYRLPFPSSGVAAAAATLPLLSFDFCSVLPFSFFRVNARIRMFVESVLISCSSERKTEGVMKNRGHK